MNRVKICKWKNNADSPLVFMIDDLANVWIDLNHNGKNDLGEDWGYFRDTENSTFRFLKEKILERYKNLKVTFYVPVGIRSNVVIESDYKIVSTMINDTEESIKFYRNLHENPRFEIAYHGTNHGKSGVIASEFIHEWQTFKNIEEARERLDFGMNIMKETIGELPKGGKYPGCASNSFSDDTIDEAGFLWWNRFSNYANNSLSKYDKQLAWIYGNDFNPISNLDIKTFGLNNIIDIPTTVGGDMLTYLFREDKRILKSSVKKIFRNKFMQKDLKYLDFLLSNKLVISIIEHIAPSRNDGTRQKPNIIDDLQSLYTILEFLENKNVWSCTGSELAQYYYLRENTSIKENDDSFFLNFTNDKGIQFEQELSLEISGCSSVKLPEGVIVFAQNGIFNLPVSEGKYIIL